jgi:predicted  nucleic acid-binding Zn-ribbon protein
MKREDLKKLELNDEAIDAVMKLHGADIEARKADLAAAQAEVDTLKGQLTEAGTTIEGFKKLDVDGIKAAADEWKAKAEQAALDATAQVSALKFDHALDSALTAAKAKNAKAVKALLKSEDLKLAEDGSIVGLKEQLETIKSENDYLFDSETPSPKIVAGGKNSSLIGDVVLDAARQAAGVTPPA